MMKKFLFIVLCLALGGIITPSKAEVNLIQTETCNNSAEQDLAKLGALAAEAGLRVFNEFSVKLDIVSFGIYSEAYKKRKAELNASTGSGSSSIGEIDQLQAKEDHSGLFEAFFRTYSWMF